MNDDQGLKKVCIFGVARLYHVYSRKPAGLLVIFQRDCHLEKAKAPEHRPFHWCCDRSSANHLGMDAERNSGGVHREKLRCEADQPGEFLPVILPDR